MRKSLSEINNSVGTLPKAKFIKRLLAFMGPAFLVSVGYMDPGNWATDIAGGSQYGYKLLWILIMSNIMALVLQNLSARLGLVTKLDLAQANHMIYPKHINIPLYAFAQTAIIACDLAEVLGFAIGLQLLFDLPLIYGVSISALDTFIILFLQNWGIKKLEAIILALIAIIGISFGIEMLLAKPSVTEIAKGFVPCTLQGNALYIAIGIIGATVMPHNLYLHSSLVQTRNFGTTLKDLKDAIKFNLIDTTIALNAAFLVNAAILILAASVFYSNGQQNITSINDAYKLLEPLLGAKLAPILFAVALIAAGQSSTVTGTLAGQIIAEGYLKLSLAPWVSRLSTRLLAILPAIITIIVFGENNIESLLILSQVVLSLQLGFAIIPLIKINSHKFFMQEFALKSKGKILSWCIAILIISLNYKLVIDFIIDLYKDKNAISLTIAVFSALVLYATYLLIYIIAKPTKKNYDTEI